MSHRFFLFAFTFAALVGPAVAQVEEEEKGPKKPPKKVVVADDDAVVDANANPAVKAYSDKLSFPHDRVTLAAGNRSFRILPVPLVFGKDKFPDEFGLQSLTDQNEKDKEDTFVTAQIRSLVPFEQIALAETEAFLKLDKPPARERLKAADQALSRALTFHEDAVADGRRKGKNWEAVKTPLVDKLLEVRLALAKETAAAKDWPALKALAVRVAERYRGQPKAMQEFAALRLLEAEDLAKSDAPSELERAAGMLRDYEVQHPATAPEAAKRLKTALAAKAKTLLEAARQVAARDQIEARNLLRTAEVLDAASPGIQELRQQLRAAVGTLVVGTRRMPEFMSPALARFDSEKQAVELIFEGLLEAVPDDALGTAYRPALAAGKPRSTPAGRDVTVAAAEWTDGSAFDAADVAGTLQLHRAKKECPGTAADLFEATIVGQILRLKAVSGHPDPRDGFTFKVLPARQMAKEGLAYDDPGFARTPFGTGPYRLSPSYRPPADGQPPKMVALSASPAYAKRHPGRPMIPEIRFLDAAKLADPAEEIRAGRLHLLPDVPTADLARYEALSNATVAKATNNRRIHLLAVNHRNPALQNVAVRKGILAAIDREAVLNEVFRAGRADVHKPLTGPFPPGSWAEQPKPAALYKPDVAKVNLGTAGESKMTLLVPADDAAGQAACAAIARQLAAAGLTTTVEAVPPREFLERLETSHRFDLAYSTHDYPSDWYPLDLARWLDPAAAGPGGRNVMGFAGTGAARADRAYYVQLAALPALRDFAGGLRPKAQEAHARFADVVPFIPLWQLDRHTVLAKGLKMPYSATLLDPTTLFAGVRDWKLD